MKILINSPTPKIESEELIKSWPCLVYNYKDEKEEQIVVLMTQDGVGMVVKAGIRAYWPVGKYGGFWRKNDGYWKLWEPENSVTLSN